MKTFRIFPFIMGLNLFLGLSPQSLAQDGQNLCSVPTLPNPPNVLFLLDNSGSMLNVVQEDDGTPTNQRRIDVLKEALFTMLEDAHHVNVGLARFSSLFEEPEPNVPILFPVSDIEGFTHKIPGEKDDTIKKVMVSMARSSDDAEENQGTGKTFLLNPQLQVVQNEKPHWIGLRFEAIDIPQGATIVSANLEFVSGTSASSSTSLSIKIEDTVDALSFTEENNDISDRTTTSEAVAWNTVNSWQEGTTYTSPDLSVLLQNVVNKSDWCGGQGGMAFIIFASGDENLSIKAYDDSPSVAPRLTVKYDSKEINGTGCINQNWSGQISASTDDAEERIADHFIFLNSTTLELGQRSQDGSDPRLVGFRFNNVPLSKEAEIVKAHLILTSQNDGKDRINGTLSLFGEKSPNASSFMRDHKNLSMRPQTSASVNWAPNETWERNMRYQSPDISAVIQEILQQPDWQTYNSLALFIQGNARYDVASFDNGPTSAAILHIQVKGLLGEDGQGDLMTVRRRLTDIVQDMEIPNSRTPLVDALYESAQYYLGKPVDYGQDRSGQAEYLVSHPGTYTGGIIEGITDDCDINTNPHHDSCANERISGNPVYVSPITSNDQPHHIVLLTDGIPSINTASSKIPALLAQLGGKTDCATSYTVPNTGETQTISSAESCGIELADALAENNIFVHVVALFLEKAWQSVYQDSETGQKIYQQAGIYYYEAGSEVPPDRIHLIEQAGYQEDIAGTQHNETALKFLCRLASQGDNSASRVEWCRDRYFHTANTIEEISTRIFPQILKAPSLAQLNIATIGDGTINIAFAPPIVEAGIVNPGNLDDNVNCTVDCKTGCAETYMQGTATKLTATPAPGFSFIGWAGDCNNSSTNPLMLMTSQQDTNCTATFEVLPNHTLTMATTGHGTVNSHGINCGTDCTETYTDSTMINLTVTPAGGSTFAGWTGTGCTDSFAITMDMNCTANFELLPSPPTPPTPSYRLQVTKTGNGTIKTIATGINCGSDCQQNYNHGTLVTLTAMPANGSTFAGWLGTDCANSFSITSDMNCTANFIPISSEEIPIDVEADQIEELSTEITHSENEPPLPSETASESGIDKNTKPEELEQSYIVDPIHIMISHHETSTEISTDEIVVGEPETTMPLNITLLNREAESDTFTITLTDSAGWTLDQLPTTIEIDGQSSVDLVLEVFLPKIDGETNTLTITVTSQKNPERTITTEVQIATRSTTTEDRQIVTPQEEPDISEPITNESEMTPTTPAPIIVESETNIVDTSDSETMTNTGSTTETPVISDNDIVETVTGDNQTTGEKEETALSDEEPTTILPTNVVEEERMPYNVVVIPPAPIPQCPATGLIDWSCKNHEQVITDATIGNQISIAGGKLAGIISNQGLISNVTIQDQTLVRGGKFSGYIINQGTLADFEFVGAKITGGTFAGTIYNNSEVGGYFSEVELAANTHIIGGIIAKKLQGDCEAPAQLENVLVKPHSQLSCVTLIGGQSETDENCITLADGVTLQNPTLAADSCVTGGQWQGNIIGNINAPARLENLEILANSHIIGVILGNGVTLADNVTYGDDVQFLNWKPSETTDSKELPSETTNSDKLPSEITDSEKLPSETKASEKLPSETTDSEELPVLESAIAVNAKGEITNSEALFSGGFSINKGPFESSTTVTLSDEVDIRGRIAIATEHQRQVMESSVVIAYQPLEDKPVFLMLDENGDFWPWHFDLASLVTFQTVETPTDMLDVPIYQGQLPAIGIINIYFGYRLTNGTVVYSPQTLDVIVNDE